MEKKEEPADTEEFLVSVWRGGRATAALYLSGVAAGDASVCPYSSNTAIGRRRARVWWAGYQHALNGGAVD